jgi:murein DD-endopeptidase MepM/ murein hydrolase activator NlpD
MSHRSKVHRHRVHNVPHAVAVHFGDDIHLSESATASLADFTLCHGGRQLRIGPIAFWIGVGTLVIMAAWSIVTATYFAFHDDFLTRLIARQADVQYAYEDRIAELRAQVDRMASRQLLDQEQYEQKLDQLVRRQSTLESRAAMLAGGADAATTGSIRPLTRSLTIGSRPPATLSGKPSPINDTVIPTPPPDREARLEPGQTPATDAHNDTAAQAGGIETTLARLQRSLDRVEVTENATLNALEERYDGKVRRMRSTLAELGLDQSKLPAAPKSAPLAVGGPLVPVKPAPDNAFERQLLRVNAARTHVDQLNRTLISVPIRKPINGELDTTSGFGMRLDPFLRSPAMHTGLDFRGETGDPVHATASGTVVHAGWSGGYGRMVEIDHGNGFSTRYGHLSGIDVEVGQSIRVGQTVGRVGSTGRSTGPHLHYETRIDGEAVDPQRFLRAAARLGTGT